MIKKKGEFRIYGRVVEKETGEGIPNLTVEAIDKDLFCHDRLGAVSTKEDGSFEILYDKEDFQDFFFDKKPDIFIRIKSPGGKVIHTTEDKVRYNADSTEMFNIAVPVDKYLPTLFKIKTTLLRPSDMLKLDFTFYNLKLTDGKLVHGVSRSPAYMVVRFPPQNIAEQAFFETAKAPDDPSTVTLEVQTPEGKPKDTDEGTGEETPHVPVESRLSGPSRLVFKVPKDAEIPFTIDGLLEACSQFELRVAPTALPPLLFLMSVINPGHLKKRVSILDTARLDIIKSSPGKASIPKGQTGKSGSLTTLKKYLPQEYDIEVRKEIAATFCKLKLMQLPPKLRKPTGLETSIEAPWRLIVSPNRYAAWAHALEPVISPTSKRVELWHTRCALRLKDKINEEEERLRTIRAIWSLDYMFPDAHIPSDDAYPDDFILQGGTKDDHYNSKLTGFWFELNNPFRMSLDAFDRRNIVHLSADYYLKRDDGKTYVPLPIQVNRLMLTPMGAWMNVRGAWEPPTGTPPNGYAVEEWRHRGTMGRDHYVRVVYKGYLFPFGHRASLIKITERKFHPDVTYLLLHAGALFGREMDAQVESSENRSKPVMAAVAKTLNTGFHRIVTSLVEAMEGKSDKEISLLVLDSERLFNKEAAAVVDNVKDKWHGQVAEFADTAKKEFRLNVDSVIDTVKIRSFPDVPGNIAFLRQRMFIVVREPEKFYIHSGVDQYDRSMPFRSVRITTLVTPNLDEPGLCGFPGHGQALFWPKVLGEYFQFHMVAEDFSGAQVEFTAPLIFAEQTKAKNKVDMNIALANYENDENNGKRRRPFDGQSVMFADGYDNPGKTTFETHYLTFSAYVPEDTNPILGEDIPWFYPKVVQAEALIPSIKHLAGNNSTATFEYAETYLSHGFDENYNKGGVFAKLTGGGVGLDFDSQGDRSGGLVKPNMQISGLSRLMGPVAGNLPDITTGTFDPEEFFGALEAKIFGAINLWDIIKLVAPGDFLSSMDKVPKLLPDISGDKLTVTLEWKPALKDWNNLFIASNGSKPAELIILARVCAQSSGEAEVDISCTLKNFTVDLLGNIQSFLLIRFDQIVFGSKGGKKADVDVKMAGIEFVGVLAFVEKLKDLIPLEGFSDPPSLDVTDKGITAGFSLALPDIAFGIFCLQNLSLGASFTIPFISEPLTVRFNFCERQSPFMLTVSAFGGGGFFAITLDPQGVHSLEASFEFGASIAVSFGVASGGVYVMAGIYFKMESNPDKAALTGYFRMGGEVDVLGIVSVSLELYLSLTYEFTSGKCVGTATLTLEVEVLFFSVSVEISVEKKFAGSNGDPSFEALMAPYQDPDTKETVNPWEIYCQAFAPVES
jgi:hypothetical protein